MPKLSKKLCDAINGQVRKEFSSAYLYLNMSTQSASNNLRGTSNWLRKQWEEELLHATKLMDYVLERGNDAALGTIEKPAFEFRSIKATFQEVLKHEQDVTASINALYELATREQDFAAQTFLQWFVTEQVEEENSAQEILDTLKIAGEEGPSLLMVDRYLGQRQSGTARSGQSGTAESSQ